MSNTYGPLTIYSRKDCGLCDEMLAGLKIWQNRYNFEIELIDIDTCPLLTERFAARIPLLVAADTEICEYHLNEQALLSFFARHKAILHA